MAYDKDNGGKNADMGMSGMPPRTHVSPAGDRGTGKNDPGYQMAHVSPSGMGMDKCCMGVTAPQQGTSKEMLSKMGAVPAPTPSH